jgi:hypothetical protein
MRTLRLGSVGMTEFSAATLAAAMQQGTFTRYLQELDLRWGLAWEHVPVCCVVCCVHGWCALYPPGRGVGDFGVRGTLSMATASLRTPVHGGHAIPLLPLRCWCRGPGLLLLPEATG